jgi:protein AbiQ
MVNGNKYCIPLSSIEEKEKYKTMSENITFRKITDKNGEVIGVLNINNMIPVREEYISQFIVDELPTDSEKQREYKKKCKAELDWCNDNIGEISRLASELHTIICENKPFKKRNICPNYAELEKECAKQKIMSKRNLKKQQKVHI